MISLLMIGLLIAILGFCAGIIYGQWEMTREVAAEYEDMIQQMELGGVFDEN